MTLGELLKFHRKKLKLNQTEVSQVLSVSQGTVSKWEHDQLEPSFTEGLRLTEVLSIPLQAIVKLTDSQCGFANANSGRE